MEQWQKDLAEMVETVTDEVERFFLGMSEMIDVFFELTEEFSEQVQNSIATDIEEYLQELTDSHLELEDAFGDLDIGFPYGVEPTEEKNAACMGCHHYHGQVYSGNLLVCGMHPHGWDDDSCPDWEGV
ncbi:hypothetical protein [Nodularia chucula]|uniref:hypothetical protein n=1 Tax=Nodularia chucula TaxID=3093667 RepID=UPI0039C72D99